MWSSQECISPSKRNWLCHSQSRESEKKTPFGQRSFAPGTLVFVPIKERQTTHLIRAKPFLESHDVSDVLGFPCGDCTGNVQNCCNDRKEESNREARAHKATILGRY